MQIMARNACAECERGGGVNTTPGRVDRTMTDMERALVLALHAYVLQLRIVIQHDFGHCIRKIYAVIQACVVLDNGCATVGCHYHQAPGIDRGRSIPLGRDVQDMDGCGSFTSDMNKSAVFKEMGIQCREGILVEKCMLRKIGLDLRVTGMLNQRCN